jgi:hypothetical protein
MAIKFGPAELAGIALYSGSLTEVTDAIRQSIHTNDQDLFSACAEAIGHCARRFKTLDQQNLTILLERASEFDPSPIVHDSIVDMFFDLEHFLGKRKITRPSKYAKAYETRISK